MRLSVVWLIWIIANNIRFLKIFEINTEPFKAMPWKVFFERLNKVTNMVTLFVIFAKIKNNDGYCQR